MADLIDRDALMKEICENECGSVCDEECENVFCNFYDYIMGAPAVNRWISCSERLPGKYGNVLLAILIKNDYGEPDYYVTIGGMKNGTEFESYTGDICECETVTHWMPLPEPPEKE